MNEELLTMKWADVADRNCIMSLSQSPALWHKIGLIAGMVFWGAVIIILEVLLLPFFLRKESVRDNTVGKKNCVGCL